MVAVKRSITIPTPEVVEAELARVRYREAYARTLRSTFCTLLAIAAAIVLLSALVLPVFRVNGTDMSPTLATGELVVTLRKAQVQPGDVIAFYYNDKIQIKRVIAVGGDVVSVDAYGEVTVNDQPLDEPYLTDKAYGECNITYPYRVSDGKIFVMGDHRSISIDSRHTEVGCVAQEQIIGKVILRVWPFSAIHVFE